MSSVETIRSQVESRIPGALTTYESRNRSVFHTGIPAVDRYGIPKGDLTEICAPSDSSSGRTAVLISLIARLTPEQQFCALVDAGDSFDSEGGQRSGMELDRLLWVRCRQKDNNKKKLTPLEQAFKAADILIQNGGFALIAVDLTSISEPALRKVPLTTWFRFARVIERTDSALVFLSNYPAAQSCAGLTLHLSGKGVTWINAVNSKPLALARVLATAAFSVDAGRMRAKKQPQSVPRSLATHAAERTADSIASPSRAL